MSIGSMVGVEQSCVDLLPWVAESAVTQALPQGLEGAQVDWTTVTSTDACVATGLSENGIHARLASVYMLVFPNRKLGLSFPGVSQSMATTRLDLGTRATTTLKVIAPGGLCAELLDCTTADLFAVRATGQGTVTEIVMALVRVSLSGGCADVGVDSDSGSPVLSPLLSRLLDDLALLARWRRLRGRDVESLIAVDIEDGAPEELQELATRIAALTPADLPGVGIGASAVEELEELFTTFDHREMAVLRDRFLAVQPKALQELGDEFGVTRERARQIELKVKRRLDGQFGFGTAVGNLLASMRIEIQPVASLERLVQLSPEIASIVPSVGVPLWLVLDRLDDYFEVTDGWAAAPGVPEAREQTRSLLEEFASSHGVVELAVLAESSTQPYDELLLWLGWCGYQILNSRVITRLRNSGDHAASILEVVGEPMNVDDIVSKMQIDRNPRSVANVLGSDDRFVRTDRSMWALAEWGVEEYTTIRNMVARAIDSHGGEIRLDALVDEVAGRYDVSRSSVQTYAASGEFEVRQGVVRRRSGRGTTRKTAAQTRRLYRHGDVWRLAVKVTHDHMRGSGFPVPAGLAALVGCGYGETVEHTSRLGDHVIRWKGNQPSSGTIRRFLEDLAVAEGDWVFLEFGPGRTFDVVRGCIVGPEADPLRRALAASGRPDAVSLPDSDLVAALGDAAGLDGEDRPRRILSAYRARGEEEITELLERAWVGGM